MPRPKFDANRPYVEAYVDGDGLTWTLAGFDGQVLSAGPLGAANLDPSAVSARVKQMYAGLPVSSANDHKAIGRDGIVFRANVDLSADLDGVHPAAVIERFLDRIR